MSLALPPAWRARAVVAAQAMRSPPALMDAVRAEVAAILAANPALPADDLSRDCLTVLVFERFQTEAGEQPATTKTAA